MHEVVGFVILILIMQAEIYSVLKFSDYIGTFWGKLSVESGGVRVIVVGRPDLISSFPMKIV